MLAIEFQGGLLGSPTGLLGLNVDDSSTRHLSLTAGGGIGGGVAGSPQLAVTGRARWPVNERFAVAGGGGLSAGGYQPILQGLFQGDSSTRSVWKTAFWLNVEGSLDTHLPTGLVLRPVVGLSTLLNAGSERCKSVTDGRPDGPLRACATSTKDAWLRTALPYAGVALGYVFSL